MTREIARKKIYDQWQKFLENNIDYAGISEAYKMAIQALEQEPCEDTDKRTEVQRAYDRGFDDGLKEGLKATAEPLRGSMKPTEKQIEYAQYLAQRMCQDLPKEYTKQAYSDFISKWKPVVTAEDIGMNEPDTWQMQYM